MKILDRVHLINSLIVNLYLIIDPDGLILIDTGLPGNIKRIARYLDGLGYKLDQIKSILITHADGDHYGSLADLQKAIPAVTYANPIEAEAIRSGQSSRSLTPSGVQKIFYSLVRPLVKTQPARVDQYLSKGQTLPGLGGIQVMDTPGHTPGHISLYSASTGILFAGDSINVTGQRLSPSAGANTWNRQMAEQSFQLQVALNPEFVCAGHGFWKR